MSYVEVINECKRYKMGETTITANDNISFAIKKGELVIILDLVQVVQGSQLFLIY